MLDYVNHDIAGCEQLKIAYDWKEHNQLVVHTKLRILAELTAKDPQPGKLTTEQVREAIKRLEDFVGILTDNLRTPGVLRTGTLPYRYSPGINGTI